MGVMPHTVSRTGMGFPRFPVCIGVSFNVVDGGGVYGHGVYGHFAYEERKENKYDRL